MRANYLLIAALLCLSSAPSLAAVAHDATGTAECVGASPLSCATLTVGTISNGVVAALVAWTGSSAPTQSATDNGTTMTLVGTQFSAAHTDGTTLFCLKAPAAGVHTIIVTQTGGGEIHLIGASFSGANQTTPCDNYTSSTDQAGTTGSLPITSASGNAAVSVQTQGDDAINAVSNTQIVIDNSGPSISISGNYATGSTNPTLTATANSSVSWQMGGMDIAAAGGGGAVTHLRLQKDVGQ